MAASDAKFVPIKNQAYRVTFVVRDRDGETAPGTTFGGTGGEPAKATISKDGGSFANSVNNITEINLALGVSGVYFLDLTASEMNADTVVVRAGTTGPAEATSPVIVLYPEPRGLRDLAYPAVSGRSLAVDASGQVDVRALAAASIPVGAYAAGAITATAIATAAFTESKFADEFFTAAKYATDAINNDALATSAVSEIVAAVWAQAMTEPGAPPAVTATLKAALEWLFVLSRNKRTQTATTEVVRNDADSATIGTSLKADDGTTYTRGEYS